jgi:hypothetical protein
MGKLSRPKPSQLHNRGSSTAPQPSLAHRSRGNCLPAPSGFVSKGVRPPYMDPGFEVGAGAITQHQSYARSGTPKVPTK